MGVSSWGEDAQKLPGNVRDISSQRPKAVAAVGETPDRFPPRARGPHARFVLPTSGLLSASLIAPAQARRSSVRDIPSGFCYQRLQQVISGFHESTTDFLQPCFGSAFCWPCCIRWA